MVERRPRCNSWGSPFFQGQNLGGHAHKKRALRSLERPILRLIGRLTQAPAPQKRGSPAAVDQRKIDLRPASRAASTASARSALSSTGRFDRPRNDMPTRKSPFSTPRCPIGPVRRPSPDPATKVSFCAQLWPVSFPTGSGPSSPNKIRPPKQRQVQRPAQHVPRLHGRASVTRQRSFGLTFAQPPHGRFALGCCQTMRTNSAACL